MRPFRLARWGSQILPLGTRTRLPFASCHCHSTGYNIRLQSLAAAQRSDPPTVVKRKRGRPRKNELLEATAAAVASAPDPAPEETTTSKREAFTDSESFAIEDDATVEDIEDATGVEEAPPSNPLQEDIPLPSLPSPPAYLASQSAKLSALHARLNLPSRLPLTTLARALIDHTADPQASYNNSSLAILGNDLLGNYMAEHLLVHYPRLPVAVLFAAQSAYVGPAALSSIAMSWGVEVAAEPGGEVDPGLLQFRRAPPGTNPEDISTLDTNRPGNRNRRGDKVSWRRGLSSRIVYDNEFGDLQPSLNASSPETATLDRAATTFVQALAGSIYLHAGAAATYSFFRAHVLSRRLDLSSLFTFTDPMKDLSRLCAREGFTSPVARLESETGRLSRHPVFVVGVYSGRDRLGVDAGASLNEARFRASVKALKGWYLYSPTDGRTGVGGRADGMGASGHSKGRVILPSQVEEVGEGAQQDEFRPAHVDAGEVVA